MENITLGQVRDIILFIVALSGGILTLYKLLMTGFDKRLQPIKDDIRNERLERLKSDLTTFIYIASKDDISPDQRMRAHEVYDLYIKMGGDSWAHDRFEKLKGEGKI